MSAWPAPWCALFVLLSLIRLPVTSSRCLPQQVQAPRPQALYYQDQEWPVVLETSDRVGHSLVTAILSIMLEEVIGYNDVRIRTSFNSMNSTEILLRLANCPRGTECDKEIGVPQTMINLEVPFDLSAPFPRAYVQDAGLLGPVGRYGWFMPSYLVDENWVNNKSITDHWRALQLDPVTSQYCLPDYQRRREHYHRRRHKKMIHSTQTAHCSRDGACATLFTTSRINQQLAKRQIHRLGLNVSLAVVGNDLYNIVSNRTARHKPSLFFDWAPNMLTATGEYTRVHFPDCPPGRRHLHSCDFQEKFLTKAVWRGLGEKSPELSYLVNRFYLNQTKYEALLRSYHKYPDRSYESAACDWLRNHPDIWRRWLPLDLYDKPTIWLGGMFPISGPYWNQPGIVPGAQLALDMINLNQSVLPYYHLDMQVMDTRCEPDLVMQRYMDYRYEFKQPLAGILGPGCSTAEPMIGVTKHSRMVVVSYAVDAATLSNRRKYPYFFRTIPRIDQSGELYLSLFQHYDWRQVALLAEENHEFFQYHAFLHEQFSSRNIDVVMDRKMVTMPDTQEAAKYLATIRETKARIIIITSYETSARAVLCQAYRQKMTQRHGYLWFLPPWFTHNWWDVDSLRRKRGKKENYIPEGMLVPCSTQEMLEAAEGHLSLASSFYAPETSNITGDITVRQWRHLYRQTLLRSKLSLDQESDYAAYAYDAVWVYAKALHLLLQEDPSAMNSLRTRQTSKRFMHYLSQTNFAGVSGPIRFQGADRPGIINLYQFQANDSLRVGQYISAQPDLNQTGRVNLYRSLRWYTNNGLRPNDGQPTGKTCSVEAFRALLNVDCDLAILIANLMGVSAVAVIMVLCLMVFKRRYDTKVRATQRRMKELGLLDTGWLCLDEWELPRDHVVLNRKLGEGAFGTVYGGEAFIYDSWQAVAVKTLKPGSNPEEKLDFLSEAEMMKRFDHRNIVKLLGVCTRGEPAYAVMEFMLHGDLKTFLLSRRHLVGGSEGNTEDVSPRGLTKMALDVACGLRYLTDLSYVHRDLACRNCLVHANKTVKIGDFGMTRPMYDSDYYRFSKKGMMPVRWMAPESLVDGIFTPSTDVWSFGILLYEMITFGSFPYQGLANKQVLHYVRTGNTLSVPPQASKKLKSVMKACWSFNDCDRPSICDICRILSDNEELLTPCLNTPASAVAMENLDHIDMEMAPQRLHKITKRSNSRSNSRTFSERGSASVVLSERSSIFSVSNVRGAIVRTQSQRNSDNPIRTSIPPSLSDPFGQVLNSCDDHDAVTCPLTDRTQDNCDDEVAPPSIGYSPKEGAEGNTHCDASCCTGSSCGDANCDDISPKSYIKFVSLSSSCEEKSDSDYGSDHSREILNGTNNNIRRKRDHSRSKLIDTESTNL